MLKCKCKTCGETWHYSSAISPMLVPNVWNKILKYYNLENQSEGTFICYKCMEKALGRKLRKRDTNDSIFNIEFKEWYCFK